MPWVRQWHNELDPAFGQSPADAYDAYLATQREKYGLTDEVLASLVPASGCREADAGGSTRSHSSPTDRRSSQDGPSSTPTPSSPINRGSSSSSSIGASFLAATVSPSRARRKLVQWRAEEPQTVWVGGDDFFVWRHQFRDVCTNEKVTCS